MKRLRKSCFGALLGLFLILGWVADINAQDDETKKGEEYMLEDVIVTGVFDERKRIDSTISITTFETEDLVKLTPISAADILKDIPGVYVNSALGEIRNVVYSRGVSAGSTEAAFGFFYVSMQEDGLPVTNFGDLNYGPDYYLRQDATLARVEAVRGGTAAITTSNSPGGIFNYISKTGGEEFSGLISLRYGLEGDLENANKRADFNIGGPLGNGYYYNVGGFYREARGAIDMGYDLNSGGQIKANILKKYDSGLFKLYAKYLNDHNLWYEFHYAQNFNDPQVIDALEGRDGAYLLPAVRTTTFEGQPFDTTKGIHNTDKAIGLQWSHDFSDSLILRNNIKYTDKRSLWNTTGAVTTHQLPVFFTVLGTGPFLKWGPFTNGTYEFYDNTTGETVATMAVPSPFAPYMTDSSGLKNMQVKENSVINHIGHMNDFYGEDLMDELTLTMRFENMTLTGGLFYGTSDGRYVNRGFGGAYSSFESHPVLYGMRFTEAATGDVYQLTNPEGFFQWFPRSIHDSTMDNLALFLAHDWSITDKWKLEWGIRWDNQDVEGVNLWYMSAGDWEGGGIDGDPLTMYDNNYDIPDPDSLTSYDRSEDTTSYSAALSYTINDSNSFYVRWTESNKTPYLSYYRGLNQDNVNDSRPEIQKTRQLEATYKLYSDNYYFLITPYFSKLYNIGSFGVGREAPDEPLYVLDPVYNDIETLGVELEGEYYINDTWSVRGTASWQDAEASKWSTWIMGADGRDDDYLEVMDGGPADNNPDIMFAITPTYDNGTIFASLTWRYMGERPANVAQTFQLKAFDYFDFAGSYTFNDNWSIQLNVNNVFNDFGVMSWQAPGNFPESLDRQAFLPEMLEADPNALFGIISIPQRSVFLTLNYTF